MRIFDAIIVVGICAVIVMGAFFTNSAYASLSLETGGTDAGDAGTLSAFRMVNAWIYIIAALLIIAVLVLAAKLYMT
jgi:hypothetical protein